MPCKCGHLAKDHPYSVGIMYCGNMPCFPCKKCDCKNYDMAPKEVVFNANST